MKMDKRETKNENQSSELMYSSPGCCFNCNKIFSDGEKSHKWLFRPCDGLGNPLDDDQSREAQATEFEQGLCQSCHEKSVGFCGETGIAYYLP